MSSYRSSTRSIGKKLLLIGEVPFHLKWKETRNFTGCPSYRPFGQNAFDAMSKVGGHSARKQVNIFSRNEFRRVMSAGARAEYPPSQRTGSFSIDQMMEALERNIAKTTTKWRSLVCSLNPGPVLRVPGASRSSRQAGCAGPA
jgi:hypothetical protein